MPLCTALRNSNIYLHLMLSLTAIEWYCSDEVDKMFFRDIEKGTLLKAYFPGIDEPIETSICLAGLGKKKNIHLLDSALFNEQPLLGMVVEYVAEDGIYRFTAHRATYVNTKLYKGILFESNEDVKRVNRRDTHRFEFCEPMEFMSRSHPSIMYGFFHDISFDGLSFTPDSDKYEYEIGDEVTINYQPKGMTLLKIIGVIKNFRIDNESEIIRYGVELNSASQNKRWALLVAEQQRKLLQKRL